MMRICLAARTVADKHVVSDMLEELFSIADNRQYRTADKSRVFPPKRVRHVNLGDYVARIESYMEDKIDEKTDPNPAYRLGSQ